MRDTVLCLCDLTGNFAAPWIEAGYRSILVDPQHGHGVSFEGTSLKVGFCIDHPVTWSVIRQYAADIAFVAAFPPCTDLAVSGARWFSSKGEEDPAFQFKAMQVVWQCHVIAEMLGVPYFIENPVSQISSLWRKPDYIFHPWQYAGWCEGDNYTKKTCLWTGGGFIMPEPKGESGLGDPDDRIHKCAPGPERANIRSATPMGFSRAVFEANKELVK